MPVYSQYSPLHRRPSVFKSYWWPVMYLLGSVVSPLNLFKALNLNLNGICLIREVLIICTCAYAPCRHPASSLSPFGGLRNSDQLLVGCQTACSQREELLPIFCVPIGQLFPRLASDWTADRALSSQLVAGCA